MRLILKPQRNLFSIDEYEKDVGVVSSDNSGCFIESSDKMRTIGEREGSQRGHHVTLSASFTWS